MNTIQRGIRNAFRNVIRTSSIVIILSISIGLIIAMLAARQAVDSRIESLKSSVGNTISVSPAGVMGFEGGGEALTTEDVAKLDDIDYVSSVTSTLTDRLATDDTTDLESSIDIGSLGQRRANENSATSGSSSSSTQSQQNMPAGGGMMGGGNPMTSVNITGTNDMSKASTFGGSTVEWTSGEAVDADADADEAVVGKSLAEKNDLQVGDTFTAYDTKLTVKGIYDAGTDFANNGVFVSLIALQRISDQADSITSASVIVDNVDNLENTTTAVSEALGDSADVTNSQETVEQLVSPLEGVRSITLFSLIGAVVAGAVIILLTMIMIVRERRREIGVMKAIGASNIGIMKQFVAESITLTTLALIVGTVIGIAASAPLTSLLVDTSSSSSQTQGPGGRGGFGGGPRMMAGGFGAGRQALENIESSVGVQTLAAGIGATLLIAILGSAIPSLMISKIKPAEAMRSE